MADIKLPVSKQKRDYMFAVGKRKSAVARVRLYDAVKDGLVWNALPVVKGELLVNGKPIANYFASETMRYVYSEPLRIVNAQNKYAITVRVVGGGPAGQLDATVAGISNALAKLDPEYRKILKAKGFLTRDSRIRERRKVGTGGKARRAKQSPKR